MSSVYERFAYKGNGDEKLIDEVYLFAYDREAFYQGVSGFLCVRSHLAHFNASSQVRREALGEQNGELVFRGTPSDGWHFPIFRDVAQG